MIRSNNFHSQQHRQLVLNVYVPHFVINGRSGFISLARGAASVDNRDDDVSVAAQIRRPIYRPFFRHGLRSGLSFSAKFTDSQPSDEQTFDLNAITQQ